jgi:hypothetical protein
MLDLKMYLSSFKHNLSLKGDGLNTKILLI